MSALSRGFRILKAVTNSAGGMTFMEVVESTALPKASAHRLLGELVELALLVYDEASRRYRGGLALATLGASVTTNYDIRRTVRPFLEDLQHVTRFVATLGVRNGDVGTYLDKIEPEDMLVRLHSEIGKSFPLHCTAMGKVLLAHSDDATIMRVTRRRLRRYTPNTICDGTTLREQLDTILAQGFAIDREEITRGLVCIAAPVRGPDGKVTAALSCTLPSYDLTRSVMEKTTQRVKAAARAASGN